MKKILILTALSVLLSACSESSDTKVSKSGSAAVSKSDEEREIIAHVNGKPIYKSRLDVYRPLAGPNVTRDDLINNVVISELLEQKAKEVGLAEGNQELDEQLTIARQTVLGRAYAEHFVQNQAVSDEEVKNRYDELKAQVSGQKEYETAHILVPDEDLAKGLLAELTKDPSRFADLAKENSQDPGSGAEGGNLGWVNPGSVVPEFAEAMVKSTPGSIYPQPVQSQFGWHIIYVQNTRDLPVPELTTDVYEEIKIGINRDKFSKHLDQLRAEAKIERPTTSADSSTSDTSNSDSTETQ